MKYQFCLLIILSVITLTGCSNSKLNTCLKENQQLRDDIQFVNQSIKEYEALEKITPEILMIGTDELEKCKTHLDNIERENATLKAKRQ